MVAEFERHSGLLRMMIILNSEGSLNIQSFMDRYGMYSTSFYRSVKKAQEMGLIIVRSGKLNRRTIKFIELTELGKRVSRELVKIEGELQSALTESGRSI